MVAQAATHGGDPAHVEGSSTDPNVDRILAVLPDATDAVGLPGSVDAACLVRLLLPSHASSAITSELPLAATGKLLRRRLR